MSRLIDVDALGIGKSMREVFKNPEYADGWNSVIDIIYNAPTVDVPDREVGEWTPVSEKLPTPNSVYETEPDYYLVQNEYDDMMVATFVKFPGGARVWQQIYQYGAIMEDIVAWMPLPEPWKGEEDE